VNLHNLRHEKVKVQLFALTKAVVAVLIAF
jgi:hypothetical protein